MPQHVVPSLGQWTLVWSPGSCCCIPVEGSRAELSLRSNEHDRYGSGLGDQRPSFSPNSAHFRGLPSCFRAFFFSPSFLLFFELQKP